jgi:hypothetical protein
MSSKSTVRKAKEMHASKNFETRLQELKEMREKNDAFLREQQELLANAKRFLETHRKESTDVCRRLDANLGYCKHLLDETEFYTQPMAREMVLIGKINGKDTHVARNVLRVPPTHGPTDVLFLEGLLQLNNLKEFEFTHHPNIVSHAASGEQVWMPTWSDHWEEVKGRLVPNYPGVENGHFRKLVKHLCDSSCGIKFQNQGLEKDSLPFVRR